MKIGLVLAGGGGKGAYQIGVLKVLYELDLVKYIHAVSGTSVGALNAALFVNNDIAVAETMWRTIHPSKILSTDSLKITKSLATYAQSLENATVQRYTKKLDGFGIFSRSGLLKMIDESIDLHKVSNSQIPFYATCTAIPKWEKTYFQLNRLPANKIKDILLASSAIPGVFSPVEIDEQLYIDGGFFDNIPIAPMYNLQCDIIIAVLLDRGAVVNKALFPNATIYEIVPQRDLGDVVTGTLNFKSSNAELRMQQGYEDAMKILKPVQEVAQREIQFYNTAVQIVKYHDEFQAKHKRNTQTIEHNMNKLMQRMKGK